MCFSPLHGFQIGTHESGKPNYKIVGGDVNWLRCPKEGDTPGLIIYKYIEIPCGKCIDCRLKYSREWADRCMLEANKHKDNYFLTLTYDDYNMPLKSLVDNETGEIFHHGNLDKQALPKFFKKLRRHYEYNYNHEGIRFYACGEYGSTTDRPHYHAIIFNLPIYDLVEFTKTKTGDTLYLSETLSKIWGNGHIMIGKVTWDTCAYTARYIMKKQKGDTAGKVLLSNGKYADLQCEFTNMSRSPGIAREYYEENKDNIYKNDEIILPGDKKARVVKPSKYYDRLYDLENPEYMKLLKEKRKESAERAEKITLSKTNLSKKEYLELKERNKKEAVKRLVRNEI